MTILAADFELNKGGFTADIKCRIDSQVTGIFGPSGAGKTSFLRSLAGLDTPKRGLIRINDKIVFDAEKQINLPPEKRKIGYVFQEGRLFPHLSVTENIRYGMNTNSSMIAFDEVVKLLRITNIVDAKISDISGGEAQRVAIGRAILSDPDLLVLDEPFSALDKQLRLHIISLLIPLIRKLKIPVLVISHDLSDLLMLTEELLIIQDGKCVGHGNYYDLIANKSTSDVLSKSGLINSIEFNVDNTSVKKGMLCLSKVGQTIYAESRTDQMATNPNIIVFLRPEDITLALHKIADISMQNQLEGTITKLLITENKVLCIIDHGFKLIAEVTLATMEKMNLKEGDKIWSLFKAAAVKMDIDPINNLV